MSLCPLQRLANKRTITQTGELIRTMDQFQEPVSSCAWVNNQILITGSFDKDQSICSWNLGLADSFPVVWTKDHRTEDLAVSPDGGWVVALDDQKRVHIYSGYTRGKVLSLELDTRGTSLSISRDSMHLLVNEQAGKATVYHLITQDILQKYEEHKGGEFLIRCYFGGANEAFVLSGSEGKRLYLTTSFDHAGLRI